MEDIDANSRLLEWEWLAARVVFAGGFGIALIAAILSSVLRPSTPTPATVLSAPEQQREHVAQQFCTTALGVAQTFGVVPGIAKPASEPQRTTVKGRYTCNAAAGQSSYAITVDLMCTDLADARCFNLFTVKQDDGTVLYQRQG